MPLDFESLKKAREEREAKEEFKRETQDWIEDMFGEPAPPPGPRKYDPNDPSTKENFLLGLLSATSYGTQEDRDAFEEQQALLQEEQIERDVRAGLYSGTEFGQLTAAQRQEVYRQAAKDRDTARYERRYEAEQRAKRRAARRQARDAQGRFANE